MEWWSSFLESQKYGQVIEHFSKSTLLTKTNLSPGPTHSKMFHLEKPNKIKTT